MVEESSIAPIQSLLQSVGQLSRHQNEIQRITGESFNLFQILGIGHYEVVTHSPILAELLDPAGRHGQGGLFLKLFLEMLGCGKPSIWDALLPDPDQSTVSRERSLGDLGRVDILIGDRMNRKLIIENKIYAGDQEKQISRYLSDSQNPLVIYLTLHGDPPSDYSFGIEEKSAGEKPDRLVCLSYQTDILTWLESCRSQVATVAQVRESLTQYIQLVRSLTGQHSNQRMNEKIASLVTGSRENLDSFLTLNESSAGIYATLIHKLNREVSEKIPDGFILESKLADNGIKWTEYSFSHPHLDKHGIRIAFAFERSGYADFFFGFRKHTDEPFDEDIVVKLHGVFADQFHPGAPTNHWPIWAWMEPRIWDRSVWMEIQFGYFSEQITSRIKDLAEMANQCLAASVENS